MYIYIYIYIYIYNTHPNNEISEYEESALELGIAAECRIPHGSTVTK